MAVTDPTDAAASEVSPTDAGELETELEGPAGGDRLIWLLAGGLFAAAGVIALLTVSSKVFGIVFVVVAMACVAFSAGYARRR